MVGSSITVFQFHIRLLVHTVQVFVKPVQQEGEELLGILLLKAVESWSVLCYRPLPNRTRMSEHIYGKKHIFGFGVCVYSNVLLTLSFKGATFFWVPLQSSCTKSP